MRKKIITSILLLTLAVGLIACGSKENEDSSSQKESVDSTEEKDANTDVEDDADEVSQDQSEEKEEMDLPNWKGVYDYYGVSIMGHDGFGIDIAYPSSHPGTVGAAIQIDPAIVLVTSLGKDQDLNPFSVTQVEDAFETSMRRILRDMKDCIGSKAKEMEFIVDSQESLTINDMPTCRTDGVCTYKVNGEDFTLPFVAYSFYTGQLEGYSYFTVVVLDNSINCPSQDPLPEGTIEAYAKKMVESVKIK